MKTRVSINEEAANSRKGAVSGSCTCGDKWSASKEIFPHLSDAVVCENCGFYVMVNQLPDGFKNLEQIGNYR